MSKGPSQFFNTISGKLEIELSTPPKQVGDLLNEYADPEAEIVQMTLKAEVFIEDQGEFRDLTPEEFDSVAFEGKKISLRGESEDIVVHEAPNGKHFTVRELLAAVEETERQTRGGSEWLGGVDVHHCYFEGIHPDEEEAGVFQIYWGS